MCSPSQDLTAWTTSPTNGYCLIGESCIQPNEVNSENQCEVPRFWPFFLLKFMERLAIVLFLHIHGHLERHATS